MISLLLALTPLWPLLLVLLTLGSNKASPWRDALLLSAPLPALVLALWATPDPAVTHLSLPWLFLGGLWWLDEIRQVFLLVTSLLWLVGGLFAQGYLGYSSASGWLRFQRLWLLTMAGNLLLILAEDLASFYAGFALMTFAGYGLVIHDRTETARAAGRYYLILALAGEGLILIGLLGLASQVAAPQMSQIAQFWQAESSGQWIWMLTLVLGFGVKAGLPLLHVWLPLAHPVAPTPASAVLSGAMVKAGLLAWWLLLPLGSESWPGVGQGLVYAGLLGALGAGLLGVGQAQIKAVLAYSTVSQMGMMIALTGAGLMSAQLWPLLLPVLLAFVTHHGLIKTNLFLSVGLPWTTKRIQALGIFLLLPPLMLVGWLGSGLLIKSGFKAALYTADLVLLVGLLTLAATATASLMLRYLWLLWQAAQPPAKSAAGKPVAALIFLWGSWAGSLLLALSLPGWPLLAELEWASLAWKDVFSLVWPVALAMVLIGLLGKKFHAWVPAGDCLWLYCYLVRGGAVVVQRLAQGFVQARHQLFLVWQRGVGVFQGRVKTARLQDWEQRYALISFAALLLVLAWLSGTGR